MPDECPKCEQDESFVFHIYFPVAEWGKYASGWECVDCGHYFYDMLRMDLVRDMGLRI